MSSRVREQLLAQIYYMLLAVVVLLRSLASNLVGAEDQGWNFSFTSSSH